MHEIRLQKHCMRCDALAKQCNAVVTLSRGSLASPTQPTPAVLDCPSKMAHCPLLALPPPLLWAQTHAPSVAVGAVSWQIRTMDSGRCATVRPTTICQICLTPVSLLQPSRHTAHPEKFAEKHFSPWLTAISISSVFLYYRPARVVVFTMNWKFA